MSNPLKITFKDRDDLISQIVVKKSDIPNAQQILTGLANSLKRYKRGDRRAMQEVIKLRKKVLNASAEVYIELEEGGLYDAVVTELKIMDLIDEDN